jgi:hypothetical protein
MKQPPPAEFTAHDLHMSETSPVAVQRALQGMEQTLLQRHETRFMKASPEL